MVSRYTYLSLSMFDFETLSSRKYFYFKNERSTLKLKVELNEMSKLSLKYLSTLLKYFWLFFKKIQG